MRYAVTGVAAALDALVAERIGLDAFRTSRASVASLMTVVPGRAGEVLQALGEVDRVADDGVLEPLLAAEQRRGDLAGRQPDPEPERRAGPPPAHAR